MISVKLFSSLIISISLITAAWGDESALGDLDSLDLEAIENLESSAISPPDDDFSLNFSDKATADAPSDLSLDLEDVGGESLDTLSELDSFDGMGSDELGDLKSDIGVELSLDEMEKNPQEKLKSELERLEEKKAFKTVPPSEDRKVLNSPFLIEGRGEKISASVGIAEKELLEIVKYLEGKIPPSEWNEIKGKKNLQRYVVQEGDWLWKISENFFGTGFYYSKIWSLNPYITNPHEITPGMILEFDTGDSLDPPSVTISKFEASEGQTPGPLLANGSGSKFNFSEFGDQVTPPWIDEREKLIKQGVYFQYSTDASYEDLQEVGQETLNSEYKKYEPPRSEILVEMPPDFEKNLEFDPEKRYIRGFKEGFFLNTFITTNIVQDFGFIAASTDENVFLQRFDRVFLDIDSSVTVRVGDKFSIYSPDGEVSHALSDRSGHRYTILAQVEILGARNDLWEAKIIEVSDLVQRGDRITVYTPKIDKIFRTFSKRIIEAALIENFSDGKLNCALGDVVYLDRGRLDGVELGTVFELFSFVDQGTGRRIVEDPAHKIGEVTVITLTDNFATALISNSSDVIEIGTLAISKSSENAARDVKGSKEVSVIEGNGASLGLEELDVELNFDDMAKDILDQADKIELTEDEIAELERKERKNSVIEEHEQDLARLQKLESDILSTEDRLNEAKNDEDKLLEQLKLDKVEKTIQDPDPNALESVDDIEDEVGLKYLEENLNEKENPYGLTKFDLEEIDELLNSEIPQASGLE